MFKNSQRDPLAVPEPTVRRPSAGPSHRTAAATEEFQPVARVVVAAASAPPRQAVVLPPRVASTLDREARAFMEVEGNTDDRTELLYRARRHAGNLTSTWTRDASDKVTEAFCGRVAALIPSRPRVAAAPSVTEFADFDDQLLY